MKKPLNPLKRTLRKAFLSSPFSGLGGLLFLFSCINLYSQDSAIGLVKYQVREGSIALETTCGHLTIQYWGDGCFRLVLTDNWSVSNPTDAVIAAQMNDIPALVSSTNDLVFQWQKYQITVKSSPFNVVFIDSLGVEKLSASYRLDMDSLNHRGFVFDLTEGEKITGGGARAIPMNRRGYLLRLNNEPHWGYGYGEENLNYSLPAFVSSQKYLLFYDAPERAWADIGKTNNNQLLLFSNKKEQSCFVILGDNYQSLLSKYAALTGTQPLPPRWALGNLQSRFGYKSQRETIEKTDSIIAAGFPLDAMIIDLYWFGKGMGDFGMGNLDWESEKWPNPKAMVQSMKQKGVKTILITEPYIMQKSSGWTIADSLKLLGKTTDGKSFVVKDFWFGPAGIIDVFDTSATDWFWQQYTRIKGDGIAGWWGDLGEPEKHPSGIIYHAGTSDDIHNIYGHYWSKMLAMGYQSDYPHERLFFLNRAGYAGSQRYSVFPWSGDVSRSWSGFNAQLPIMLGMSLNGIPYMHSDLGGFAAGTKDEELYRRWLQFGVFNPVFRPHGESIPSEPIYFNDSTQAIVKEAIKLRYRLLPYNYTLAWEQTAKGLPLARPLIWYHPENNDWFDVYDTYYWGENFLISPVIEPHQQVKSMPIPSGVWFDFYTNQIIEGGKTYDAKIVAEHIPVFVKAGSIIPLANDYQSTDFYRTDTLNVHFYSHPSVSHSTYTLFDDDGQDALSLDNGAYQLIYFNGECDDKKITFEINEEGTYPNAPTNRYYNLLVQLDKKPKKVLIDGKTVKRSKYTYDEESRLLSIGFNNPTNRITLIVMK